MIFPQPKKEKYEDGFYCSKLSCTDDLYELYIKCKNGEINIITDSLLGEDEYYLDVKADGITVRAKGDCGVFRAVSSLIQLIDNDGKIQLCSIYDSPDFEKRAYMLDISRGRIPQNGNDYFFDRYTLKAQIQ